MFADNFARTELIRTKDDARFRPMGLSEGPDGSLYVMDSNIGRIWRIEYRNSNRPASEADRATLRQRRDSLSYLRRPDEKKDLISSR